MKVKELMQYSEWMQSSGYGDIHQPEISILLPTYRRLEGGHFERCVDSLLVQTFIRF
jgi:hypothetical protein